MSRQGSRARPVATLALGALALLASLVPGLAPVLQLDRTISLWSEPWRVLSAHLVHFGTQHLAWDVAVFSALGLVAEVRHPLATRTALLLSALLIPATFLVADPDLDRYRGMSGLATALFAVVLVTVHRDARSPALRAVVSACGLGFLGKLIFETALAQPVFVSAVDFAPVPSAHLTGAAAGCLAAVGLSRPRRGSVAKARPARRGVERIYSESSPASNSSSAIMSRAPWTTRATRIPSPNGS